MLRRLADHVHAVQVGADLVILDLAADGYLALRAPQGLRLDETRRQISADEDVLLQLEASGVLLAGGCGGRFRLREAAAAPPRLSAEGAERPRVPDVLQFAAAVAGAPWRWGRGSLRPLVGYAARRRRPVAAAPTSETLRRARVFPELLVSSPWQGECLYRSYLLLRFLRAGGCDAAWVFGVRTWPFGAHCWLQVGDVVLNDHPDRLASFAHILVV